jgi:hypothetical protein
MKRLLLFSFGVVFAGAIFAQAQPAHNPNLNATITKEGINQLGQNQEDPSRDAVIVLTFEGCGNLDAILNFYNGGTSSQGNSGTNYGVSFGSTSLSLIDGDAGGTGNTGNEPSGETVLFFLETNAVLNVPAGFTTGFSFYYAAPYYTGQVYVYDGLDGTGTLLGSLFLPINGPGPGDPNGVYSNWSVASVPFSGTAKSIVFGGTPNYIVYDDVTFGSVTPGGGGEPTPVSDWALYLALGLIIMFASFRVWRISR